MDDQNQTPGGQTPPSPQPAGDGGGQPTWTPPAEPNPAPDQSGQTPPPAPTEQPAGGSMA
ncbi:MAG: hypothetical protein A3F31_05580 [Candidatus Levybacteria bacterium RIFCSPHIGHO2_12_FULL_38_12]|nr:MAG: hypothetical protein A2770_00065 [Candidatus Levybacteria bacterium RIFCSPHIGHO2_01_FULL_38_12]OGH23088.1 MAG: hypothetical protein A3F31_05580 [Candidatus Levybacteria bacterium RIFCSPHIGHO2_12_FULL_38_12]OGH33806.1 MAG: hypothetical protein A3A47_02040 [Candidatus Levybacteria bacterium RIFCSPLOWO2_01_FULL_37_20]OGH44781.1 MAG: hypothetical protein A3J14_02300 [Candidatus Levybacteria bacterium RIFCSPLOWO2_02_FULL_37_18]